MSNVGIVRVAERSDVGLVWIHALHMAEAAGLDRLTAQVFAGQAAAIGDFAAACGEPTEVELQQDPLSARLLLSRAAYVVARRDLELPEGVHETSRGDSIELRAEVPSAEEAALPSHPAWMPDALAALARLRTDNARLRDELAETNRGVTALYVELDEHAKRLERADEQKDEFIAMLGHELRNPLGAAVMATEVLDQGNLASAERARAVLRRQLGNLRRIVDDLLEVSRLARGKLSVDLEPIDLRDPLRNVAHDHRPRAEAARHQLHLELPDEPLPTKADRPRLEQVFGNLLDNAVKYTPPGGRIALTATRFEHDGERFAEVKVADTGEGIEPDRLEEIFDSFVQAPRTLDRAQGGLGLGLSLVRRLVELHDGRIWAQSDGRGKGSQFIVRLPLADAAAG